MNLRQNWCQSFHLASTCCCSRPILRWPANIMGICHKIRFFIQQWNNLKNWSRWGQVIDKFESTILLTQSIFNLLIYSLLFIFFTSFNVILELFQLVWKVFWESFINRFLLYIRCVGATSLCVWRLYKGMRLTSQKKTAGSRQHELDPAEAVKASNNGRVRFS